MAAEGQHGWKGELGSVGWTGARGCFGWMATGTYCISTGHAAQCRAAAWTGGECGGEWTHVYE